ncbi:MAG: hypothetical protein HWN66_04965 [Candidatus Helarchaeota archaeon]|nr:hypothetical protein [Candidatus Helarchaeota archaeon]
MAEQMGEINKFMAEIIRLLTDLVQAVQQNEDLLRETQSIIKNSQNMIENISQSAGMQNIMAAGQSLENAIAMLQKGVQAFEIQNALRQVQEFLGAMGGSISSTRQSTSPSGQPQGVAPQKQASGKDSLIKPSDLFK